MLFKTLGGRTTNIYLDSYRIDWQKPSVSKFQTRVKQFLFENFRYLSWYEEVGLNAELSALRVDFLCKYRDPKGNKKCLVIEADGAFHDAFNPFFHKDESAFLDSLERDFAKSAWCDLNDIPLLRIYPEDEPLTLESFNKRFNSPLDLAQKLL